MFHIVLVTVVSIDPVVVVLVVAAVVVAQVLHKRHDQVSGGSPGGGEWDGVGQGGGGGREYASFRITLLADYHTWLDTVQRSVIVTVARRHTWLPW